MSRKLPSFIVLAPFAAVALLSLSTPVWAAPSADKPALAFSRFWPVPALEWSHPPEEVRAAAAALHDACAAWPKRVLPASEPPALLPAEDAPYVKTCSLALDAKTFIEVSLLKGIALLEVESGIGLASFLAANFLLFGLIYVIVHGLGMLWARRHRLNGRPE